MIMAFQPIEMAELAGLTNAVRGTAARVRICLS
jgi:hypothetical protein